MQLHEPYRTLLGHFRHESRPLLLGSADQRHGRASRRSATLFGDERADYGAALQRHYQSGARPDWQDGFVTAYATAHPWEDWAETWAHYLHMTDTLETAAACGISIAAAAPDEPALKHVRRPRSPDAPSFDRLMDSWFPLTYVLNNLNRGLGLRRRAIRSCSRQAVEKLRFVHDTISTRA